MFHYVYMLISLNTKKHISYVGYSSNIKKRLIMHNKGKGAKFTRGKKWKIIFKKKLLSKNDALKFEYSLKKNIKLRKKIKEKFINEYSNNR
tara:strand:+ start:131 stop:403 length:273 start_codon:yes stop_codon:yes gene_type:complete